jgi:hypothetical protein
MRLCALTVLFTGALINLTTAQSQPNTLSLLQQKYMNFDYSGVINSGNLILRTTSNLTRNDSLEIFRLQGLSYYALADMPASLHCFISILQLAPDFKLHPRDNPPKVIDFFEEIRHTLLKPVSAAHEKSSASSSDFTPIPVSSGLGITTCNLSKVIGYSLILPGMGHLQCGQKSKGWILFSSGLLTLGSSIYFIFDTITKEDAYLAATNKDEIEAKYRDYNQAYKIRNTSLVLFGTIWLYAQLDLLYWSKPYQQTIAVRPAHDYDGRTCLSVQIFF